MKLIINSLVSKKVLAAFWAVLVSFMVVQFIKDELFTKLTTQRFTWPKTVAELAETADIKFYSNQIFYMQTSGVASLEKISEKSIYLTAENLMTQVGLLRSGQTSFIARSVDVANFRNFLHPEKFAFLEEKYFLTHEVFYVSTKWAHHQRFVQM